MATRAWRAAFEVSGLRLPWGSSRRLLEVSETILSGLFSLSAMCLSVCLSISLSIFQSVYLSCWGSSTHRGIDEGSAGKDNGQIRFKV